jgi:hypothetical protein
MTSRQIQKRTMRKFELSLESLDARIVPAGLHAGSFAAAGMSSLVDAGNHGAGRHINTKNLHGTPFEQVNSGNQVHLNLFVVRQNSHFRHNHLKAIGTPFVVSGTNQQVTAPVQFQVKGPSFTNTTPTTQQVTAPVQYQVRGSTFNDTTPTNQQTSTPVQYQVRSSTPSDTTTTIPGSNTATTPTFTAVSSTPPKAIGSFGTSQSTDSTTPPVEYMTR